MSLFETISQRGHEQITLFNLPNSGLKAIVAIHNTALGPALGGCRMWQYASDDLAIEDALRLSMGMTYKAAVAGLNLGGGKAVIIGDANTQKSDALFADFGRAVNSLGGRYVTAEDVGINVEDMDIVAKHTDCVVGVGRDQGGSGDPSPFTAFGTMQGFKACLQKQFGHNDFSKCSFTVQGLGHVGYHLCKLLHEAGAKIVVSDINQDAVARVVNEFNAEPVAPEDIYSVDTDVFAPCALGGIISPDTINKLHFKIVAGSANNQLSTDDMSDELSKRGILYAPDYVMNAGGLINVAIELEGYDEKRSLAQVANIEHTMLDIFKIADRDNINCLAAANRWAEDRIKAAPKPYHFPAKSERFEIKQRLSA